MPIIKRLSYTPDDGAPSLPQTPKQHAEVTIKINCSDLAFIYGLIKQYKPKGDVYVISRQLLLEDIREVLNVDSRFNPLNLLP